MVVVVVPRPMLRLNWLFGKTRLSLQQHVFRLKRHLAVGRRHDPSCLIGGAAVVGREGHLVVGLAGSPLKPLLFLLVHLLLPQLLGLMLLVFRRRRAHVRGAPRVAEGRGVVGRVGGLRDRGVVVRRVVAVLLPVEAAVLGEEPLLLVANAADLGGRRDADGEAAALLGAQKGLVAAHVPPTQAHPLQVVDARLALDLLQGRRGMRG